MAFEPVPEEVERVATAVIGAAIEVHRHLGPGFIERIYHEALCEELHLREVPYERECPVVVNYKGVAIAGQRIDLIVNRLLSWLLS
jgi:GxxExxY protein